MQGDRLHGHRNVETCSNKDTPEVMAWKTTAYSLAVGKKKEKKF